MYGGFMKKLLAIVLVSGVLNIGAMGLGPQDSPLVASRPLDFTPQARLLTAAKEGKLEQVKKLLSDNLYSKEQLQNVLNKLSGISGSNSEEIQNLLKAKLYRIEHPFVKLQ